MRQNGRLHSWYDQIAEELKKNSIISIFGKCLGSGFIDQMKARGIEVEEIIYVKSGLTGRAFHVHVNDQTGEMEFYRKPQKELEQHIFKVKT